MQLFLFEIVTTAIFTVTILLLWSVCSYYLMPCSVIDLLLLLFGTKTSFEDAGGEKYKNVQKIPIHEPFVSNM